MIKYNLNDWHEDDISLSVIGISSHYADYKTAYTINRILQSNLKCSQEPYCRSTSGLSERFVFYKNNASKVLPDFFLIDNQSLIERNNIALGPLFKESTSSSHKFLKKLVNWDYLLLFTIDSQAIKPIFQDLLSAFHLIQLIEFQSLSKDDRYTFTTFYYEN